MHSSDIQPSTAEQFVTLSRVVLGAGSLAFSAWGLIDPKGMAGALGDDPGVARPLAIRDGVIGVALLHPRGGTLPLLARIAADISDAVRLARRSPKVAAGALAFAAWSGATLALMQRRRLAESA
jgi:hypothetical protein